MRKELIEKFVGKEVAFRVKNCYYWLRGSLISVDDTSISVLHNGHYQVHETDSITSIEEAVRTRGVRNE